MKIISFIFYPLVSLTITYMQLEEKNWEAVFSQDSEKLNEMITPRFVKLQLHTSGIYCNEDEIPPLQDVVEFPRM